MLMLVSALSLSPSTASAFDLGDLIRRILSGSTYTGDDTRPPAVPEPSGAIVMGVALAAVALAVRRKTR
jgi:hypothetical protein